MTAALLLLLLLLAAGSSAAALIFRHKQDEAEQNLARAVRAEDEKEEQLWHALVAQARAGRFSQRAGQRFDSLAALAQAVRLSRSRQMPADALDRLRNDAIACLALPDVRVREWDGWPEGSVGLDLNGVRNLYARSDWQGSVSVRRLEDDVETAHLAGDGSKVMPHFSPDGRVLLLRELGDAHGIKAWRPGEDRPFLEIPGRPDLKEVQINPDASRFAVGYEDGTVELFELPSGRRTVFPSQHKFFQMRFSPEGRWLAVSRRGSLTLYDLRAGTQRSLEQGAEVCWMWFGPRDRQLATLAGGYQHPEMRFVRLFDLETGKRIGRLEHMDSVCSISWHPDGNTLATGTFDLSTVTLWNVPEQTKKHVLTEHRGGGMLVAFNRTGDLLLSYSKWGGGIRLWHARSGKLLLVSPEKIFAQLPTTQSSPPLHAESEERLLIGLVPSGRRLRLWEAYPSREHRVLAHEPLDQKLANFYSVTIHPDGRLLAAGLEEGVGLWDLLSGDRVEFLPIDSTTGAVFDGTGALWTSGLSNLRRWPVQKEANAAGHFQLGPPKVFPIRANFGRVSVSHEGRTAATTAALQRGSVILHLDRLDPFLHLPQQNDARGISISPDGNLLAAASFFKDSRTPGLAVKIWQTDTGKLVKALPVAPGAFPLFSPDGRWLVVVAQAKEIRLWSVPDWQEYPSIKGIAAAFTPDSKHLAVETGNGMLRLLRIPDGHTLALLENPNQARAVAITFTPDGTRLIFASNDDRAIHVWDLRTLRARLAELGLDWEQEPFPPVQAGSAAERLQVTTRLSPVAKKPSPCP